MSLKLIMNWDIKEGMDQEYFEFVVREWVPTTAKIGLQMTGAWFTVYSRDTNSPQIMAEAITEDAATMQEALSSPEWQDLHDRLSEYVRNYTQKVVRTTGGFQL